MSVGAPRPPQTPGRAERVRLGLDGLVQLRVDALQLGDLVAQLHVERVENFVLRLLRRQRHLQLVL